MDVQKVGMLMRVKENTVKGRLNVLITSQKDLRLGIETVVKRITDIEGCSLLVEDIKGYGVPIQLFVETKEVEDEFKELLGDIDVNIVNMGFKKQDNESPSTKQGLVDSVKVEEDMKEVKPQVKVVLTDDTKQTVIKPTTSTEKMGNKTVKMIAKMLKSFRLPHVLEQDNLPSNLENDIKDIEKFILHVTKRKPINATISLVQDTCLIIASSYSEDSARELKENLLDIFDLHQ